jgi:O-acetyl-ADP-ribose deacetylase (regulator of RNase III)
LEFTYTSSSNTQLIFLHNSSIISVLILDITTPHTLMVFMTNIQLVTQNIVNIPCGMIAHGCNTSGGFGSGVAGAIRKKFPQAAIAHQRKGTGAHLLGTVDFVNVAENIIVANCYTQEFFGADGKVYADVSHIEKALGICFAEAERLDVPLYVPQIGCGLGGLVWDADVEPIIAKHIDNFNVDVTVCVL